MASTEPPVILAVDDSPELLVLMSKLLQKDYRVLTADDRGTAIDYAHGKPRPDLILLDVEMPGASGFELCRELKRDPKTADIPVIFLTGKVDAKAQVEGLELGAIDYIAKPINAAVLKARVRTQMTLIKHRAELEQMVKERTAQLESTRRQLIQRLARAMEMHETTAVGNRVMRLGQYARLVAQAAGAPPEVCERAMLSAPLHDVGKLGVPAEILRKRGKLTAPDWERVRRHPEIGAEIIGTHDDPLLRMAREMALTHHERWDGSGYPRGLKGDAIPWSGRLMAVVDAFEAMTSTQFYRDPMPLLAAATEIQGYSGKRYDPKLIEAFKLALPTMRKVREAYSDELGDLINLDFARPRDAKDKPDKVAP